MTGRIALVIPYFGALPVYFRYFIKGLENSPLIDLHLFTDAPRPTHRPSNLKVHPFSIREFDALASKRLGVPVHLAVPYKICDFRPAFGEIFGECIRDYEFWAFGDIDLIYGDLSAFLSPLLSSHDVLSFRKGWISGSLCVLRNTEVVNSLYRNSSDWRTVFTSPCNLLFDEMGGHLYQEVSGGADLLQLKGEVESFTHVVKKYDKSGCIRVGFNDFACEDIPWGETITFEDGQLHRRDGSVVMFVHYVAMRRRFFAVPNVTSAPNHFFIRRTGIYLSPPRFTTTCTRELGRIALGAVRGGQTSSPLHTLQGSQ